MARYAEKRLRGSISAEFLVLLASRALGTIALVIILHGCAADPKFRLPGESPAGIANRPRGVTINSIDGAERITIAGAQGETVAFSMVIEAHDREFRSAEIVMVPAGVDDTALPSDAFSFFVMQLVQVQQWPGWHIRQFDPSRRHDSVFDALVPLNAPKGGLPHTIKPGVPVHLWVDVAIPQDANAGVHSNQFRLLACGQPVASISIETESFPFALPNGEELDVLVEVDKQLLLDGAAGGSNGPSKAASMGASAGDAYASFQTSLHQTARFLRSHGLAPVFPWLEPNWGWSEGGRVALNWEEYDSIVMSMLDGSLFDDNRPLKYWALPGERVWGAKGTRPLSASGEDNIARDYLRDVLAHFQARSWIDRSYLRIPQNGEHSVETEVAERIARLMPNSPKVPHLVAFGWPQDIGALGWTGYRAMHWPDAVTVWAPPAQFFDLSAEFADPKKAHDSHWFVVDRPPFSGSLDVRSPSLVFARVLPWQAHVSKSPVLWLGSTDRPGELMASDGSASGLTQYRPLVRSGREYGLTEPIPTVRLKALRAGIDDLRYAKLLREKGGGHIADAVASSIVRSVGSRAYNTSYADSRAIGWCTESEFCAGAREIMARSIVHQMEKQNNPQTPGTENTSWNAAWRRLMEQERVVRFESVGARLKPPRPRSAGKLVWRFAAQIVNESRTGFSGLLRLAESARNQGLVEGETVAVDVDRDNAGVVSLSAAMAAVPCWPMGVQSVDLEILYGGEAPSGVVRSRVACVSATAMARAATIDGDLADWGLGECNVAGQFRLISASQSNVKHWMRKVADAAPAMPTVAFLGTNAESLYVAINCKSDLRPESKSSRRNTVTYDDMIPIGEELVEVLIDPFNSGSRSPADLYHIVVKRDGVVLTERGVQFRPPVGECQPWSPKIEVATGEYSDGWTVELKIPLDSWSSAPTSQAVWGLNVTRFDLANQQFSTWSGAIRNAYDPLSLGNLVLP